MVYLVGGFGSAFLLSYVIVYLGLKKWCSKKYEKLKENGGESVYFLVLGIALSIIIIAGESKFR